MNRIHPAAVAALSLTAAALTANAQSAVQPLTQNDAPVADRVATDSKGVKPTAPRKFKRVWTFAVARDEDFVRKAEANKYARRTSNKSLKAG